MVGKQWAHIVDEQQTHTDVCYKQQIHTDVCDNRHTVLFLYYTFPFRSIER